MDDDLLAVRLHGLMRWWAHGRVVRRVVALFASDDAGPTISFISSASTARYFINDSTDFPPPRTQEDSGTVQLCFFSTFRFLGFVVTTNLSIHTAIIRDSCGSTCTSDISLLQ